MASIEESKLESIDCLNTSPKTMEENGAFKFTHLFKSPGVKNTQNDRRKAFLETIKKRRNTSIDEIRGITEIFDKIEKKVEDEPMDVTQNVKVVRKRKYAQMFMFSEYLREMPDDLENNWLLKLCPTGVRNLVVAQRRTTKAYNKRGVQQAEFKSLLPGGGLNNQGSRFTILDCIFNPTSKTYFVLDILAWNSYSLMNCSSEFRFFFLHSKLEEIPELSEQTQLNKYPILEVTSRPAQMCLIEDALNVSKMDDGRDESLDGLLFYHSEMDYRPGTTPLVGWLKPYMVPEILNIPVCNRYLLEKPEKYTTLEEHIEFYNRKRRCRQKKINDVHMIDEPVEDVEEKMCV